MNNIAKIITELTVVVSALATLVVNVLNGKREIEQGLHKKIVTQSTIDSVIIERMEHAKELLHSDRIQVYEFHNGGHYANGRSALKSTCTFEVTKAGVKPTQFFLNNIPLSCMPRFMSVLLSDGVIHAINIEDIREKMPSFYHIQKGIDVHSFYAITINNSYGESIGFLMIQQLSGELILSDDDKKQILKLKLSIENELDKSMNNNNDINGKNKYISKK